MLKVVLLLVLFIDVASAQVESTLIQRVQTFLATRGKAVDFDARRPLVMFEDGSDGKGAYIAKFDPSLGAAPTVSDGFTDYELHRIAK